MSSFYKQLPLNCKGNIKITGADPTTLSSHTFLHEIYPYVVKMRSALKNHIYFTKKGTINTNTPERITICENNCS